MPSGRGPCGRFRASWMVVPGGRLRRRVMWNRHGGPNDAAAAQAQQSRVDVHHDAAPLSRRCARSSSERELLYRGPADRGCCARNTGEARCGCLARYSSSFHRSIRATANAGSSPGAVPPPCLLSRDSAAARNVFTPWPAGDWHEAASGIWLLPGGARRARIRRAGVE
jgi:hypothetical protein